MKIKMNQRITEDADIQATIGDVASAYGEKAAKETEATIVKMSKMGDFNIDNDIIEDDDDDDGDLEIQLNASLEQARQIQKLVDQTASSDDPLDITHLPKPANLLFIGPAGTGKTGRIRSWCDDNGIILVHKDAKTMDPTDLGGIISRQVDDEGNQTNKAVKLRNTEFDVLDTPNTILFLDELNRAPFDVQGSLLTLIQDHTVPSSDGEKYLSGFMFTIAAVNPSTGKAKKAYKTQDLDNAMKTRFGTYKTMYQNMKHLKYLRDRMYGPLIRRQDIDDEDRLDFTNRYYLAKAILTDPRFHFTSADEEDQFAGTDDKPTNYRSFDTAIDRSRGNKFKLLQEWSHYCDPHQLPLIKDILTDYVERDIYSLNLDGADADNEANDVFKDDRFNKEKSAPEDSAYEELLSSLGSLGDN